MDALREVSQRYDANDFDTDTLRAHIEHDIELLEDYETGFAHHPGEGRQTPDAERSVWPTSR